MTEPLESGRGRKIALSGPRWILAAFGVAALAIVVAAIWLLNKEQPTNSEAERAVREGLGIPQPEEFVFAYPVTGDPIPFDPRCDVNCVQRDLPPNRTYAQVGEPPQGFVAVDPPPLHCGLLSVRFSEQSAVEISDEPMPAFLDAAPLALLQACNPDVPLRVERGMVQVPPWYRTVYGVAISVPVIIFDADFRMTVCARDRAGTAVQFTANQDARTMISEPPTHCSDI